MDRMNGRACSVCGMPFVEHAVCQNSACPLYDVDQDDFSRCLPSLLPEVDDDKTPVRPPSIKSAPRESRRPPSPCVMSTIPPRRQSFSSIVMQRSKGSDVYVPSSPLLPSGVSGTYRIHDDREEACTPLSACACYRSCDSKK